MVGARHAVPLLDSGACPGPDPGFAGMTALFLHYDTFLRERGYFYFYDSIIGE